uniref:Uncharacterized protein n=1 Tax=Apteryx owenii TaxID=8824 RepID=A0A8B9PB75_APTOW
MRYGMFKRTLFSLRALHPIPLFCNDALVGYGTCTCWHSEMFVVLLRQLIKGLLGMEKKRVKKSCLFKAAN